MLKKTQVAVPIIKNNAELVKVMDKVVPAIDSAHVR